MARRRGRGNEQRSNTDHASRHPRALARTDCPGGSVRGTLDLSARYDALPLGGAAGERLYLGAVKENPQGCTYDIVEWTPVR